MVKADLNQKKVSLALKIKKSAFTRAVILSKLWVALLNHFGSIKLLVVLLSFWLFSTNLLLTTFLSDFGLVVVAILTLVVLNIEVNKAAILLNLLINC